MSERPALILLLDMREALDRILMYTEGYDEERFLADLRTQDAVVRNLEIIGEAADRLELAFRQRHDHIEWHRIIGLRHRVVHDYFGVDPEMVWVIVRNDVPALKRDLEAICA